jgi:hypothetical protein
MNRKMKTGLVITWRAGSPEAIEKDRRQYHYSEDRACTSLTESHLLTNVILWFSI